MATINGLFLNICGDRYDYAKTWPKRRPKFITFVKDLETRPDIIALVECQRSTALPIAEALGMKVTSFKGSSLLYNPRKLIYRRDLVERRWLGGSQTHSLLGVEFETLLTAQRFNVLVSHFPPFAWRAKLRKAQAQTINKDVADWRDPTILCIDANWRKTFADFMLRAGWRLPVNLVVTSIDYVLRRGGQKLWTATSAPYPFSDHAPILWEFEL